MKKALLLVMSFAVYGLQAQVGINTTNPEKTLDVNGEVKVRTLKNNPSPEKVVVVGADNVLSTAPLSAAGGVVISGGGSGTYTVGKNYTCNEKNKYKIIWLQQGAIKCKYKSSSYSYNSPYYWEYSGTFTGLNGSSISVSSGIHNTTEAQIGYHYSNSFYNLATITSGYSYSLNGSGVTFPLRVIDDSQYIP